MGMKTKLIDDFMENVVANSSTETSDACDIGSAYGFSIRVAYTGAGLAGTIKLEASLDETNWEDVSGTSTAVSAAGGSVLFNIGDAFYRYIRVSFQETNGAAATINAKIYTKGL